MRIVRALSTAIGLLLVLTLPVTATDHDVERCGTEDESFVCDEIHVRFEDGADVEEVIRNHGGDPETDIIRETAVLNGYLIAVERGNQIETVADYISDFRNVRSAELLPWRPEYGDGGLPNTATPAPFGSPLIPALGIFVAFVAALSMTLYRRRVLSRQ